MGANRLAVAAIGIAAVVAAGSGAYLATRHNAAESLATPAAEATDLLPVTGTGGATAETEAVIEEPAPLVEVASPPETRAPRVETPVPREVARPAPVRRSPPAAAPAPPPRPAPVAPEPVAPPPAREPIDTTVERSVDADPLPAVVAETPEPVVEEPRREFEELIVSADSVLGLQIETAVSSEQARVEDQIEARVTRDVRVADSVAIPAGSRVLGSVTVVDRGGKVKERARLGVRFHTLVLADGTRTNINTETLYREGASPSGESAAKIGGGAIGGAILGAILGGGKGAVIGGTAGAAGGTAAVMAGGRNAATLPAGSTVTVRILDPVTITVER